MMKKHLKYIILVITFSMILATTTGCGSNHDDSTEPVEPGQTVKADPEDVAIEQEPEPDERTDDASEEAEVETVKKAVVKVDNLRLRSGPGPDYEILDHLSLGTVLDVVSFEGDWLQVIMLPFENGWVHRDYVGVAEDPAMLYFEPDGSLLHVKYFMDNAIPFWVGDSIPQFNNPDDIRNDDFINMLVMIRTQKGLSPHHSNTKSGQNRPGKLVTRQNR